MDGWRDILHFDFHGEHVLFSGLRLSTGSTFLLASTLTVFLCLLEKYLSFLLSSKQIPFSSRDSRLGNAALRAGVYWVLTLIRLLYMLLAMTFHVGLILVVVTTLSAGQFIIEYIESPPLQLERRFVEGTPLLGRRDLPNSAEYLDLSATSYPPQRKVDDIQETPRVPDIIVNDARNIFTIEDAEDAA